MQQQGKQVKALVYALFMVFLSKLGFPMPPIGISQLFVTIAPSSIDLIRQIDLAAHLCVSQMSHAKEYIVS